MKLTESSETRRPPPQSLLCPLSEAFIGWVKFTQKDLHFALTINVCGMY